MECIEERALKSSFLSQTGVKTGSNDDVWCLAALNSVPSDDFPVEDLLNLDFSEKELQEGCFFVEDEEEKASKETNSNDFSSIFSGADEFDSFSAGELAVPVEDLENLEWLSQFVDDSEPGLSLVWPAGSFMAKTEASSGGNRVDKLSKPVQKTRSTLCFPTEVSRKPRSKRSKENGRPWPLSSPALSSDESSSVSSCSSGSITIPPFVFTSPVQDMELFTSVEKPPAKKHKIKQEAAGGFVSGRRCTHCLVQKTPQWRAGPLGPKTLCNACGVRFKSGRLFPEYRPACSPTFSQEIHSNSHRKVLEMRRRKEVHGAAEQDLLANV
ncbi:GATA transcription factor 5 [Dorcoceras hygrometricum]|uniref:GATA transcription factor n=1 Tax=Dorcoceras hygrometricum TaxID=472368 RepID=A0A2Z7DD10_9LAMI|nr:GATA transcription factor 5 [Dorcoceras hygrometricum]